MHAMEKTDMELIISYCILSLLDSGELCLARDHDINTHTQVFYIGNSWEPEWEAQEGARLVLDSSC